MGLDALVFFPGLALLLWVMHKVSFSAIRDELRKLEELENKAISLKVEKVGISEEINQNYQLSQIKQGIWRRYYLALGSQLILAMLGVLIVIELGWAWWQ
jgi:hypothetical protein